MSIIISLNIFGVPFVFNLKLPINSWKKRLLTTFFFCLLHTFNYLSFFFSFTFFFTFDGQLCLLTFAIVYRLTQVAKLVHSQFSHSSLRAIRQMFLVDNGSSPFQKKSNRQRISSPLGIFLAIFFNLSAICQFALILDMLIQ